MGNLSPTRPCSGAPGPFVRTPGEALSRSGRVPALHVAHPGPVKTYAGRTWLIAAGAYTQTAVLDPVRVGRRSGSLPVCCRKPAWPSHDGAAREDGPDAFRAVEHVGFRVSPALARRPGQAGHGLTHLRERSRS